METQLAWEPEFELDADCEMPLAETPQPAVEIVMQGTTPNPADRRQAAKDPEDYII